MKKFLKPTYIAAKAWLRLLEDRPNTSLNQIAMYNLLLTSLTQSHLVICMTRSEGSETNSNLLMSNVSFGKALINARHLLTILFSVKPEMILGAQGFRAPNATVFCRVVCAIATASMAIVAIDYYHLHKSNSYALKI